MMPKRKKDLFKGHNKRKLAVAKIISGFKGIILEEMHPFKSDMSIRDAMKNNTQLNRITDKGDEAMGLDYRLKSNKTRKTIEIAIRFDTDSSLYFKKPSDISLESFIQSNLVCYYFLIINQNCTLYYLLAVPDLLNIAKPLLNKTKGNRNRIDFFNKRTGKTILPTTFGMYSIKGSRGLIGNSLSLEDALINILK